MQSAGCWAICSAVLKNPNAAILELDFEVSSLQIHRPTSPLCHIAQYFDMLFNNDNCRVTVHLFTSKPLLR